MIVNNNIFLEIKQMTTELESNFDWYGVATKWIYFVFGIAGGLFLGSILS
jgi:hypothetical protein